MKALNELLVVINQCNFDVAADLLNLYVHLKKSLHSSN